MASTPINTAGYRHLGIQIPTFNALNISTGDNVVVAAVAGKRILLLNASISTATVGQTVTFYSGSSSGENLGTIRPLTSSTTILDSPFGLFATEEGEALVFTLGTTGAVTGTLSYIFI